MNPDLISTPSRPHLRRRRQPSPAFKAASRLFAPLLALAISASHAATLTWDTVSGDGGNITAGDGTWNTTAGNTVWNNAGSNVVWSQTDTTTGTNEAVFAGSDGTHAVTVGATIAAQKILFSNSGYTLSATSAQNLLEDTLSTGGGLTKSGTGILTLSGTNSYTGDTTVTGTTTDKLFVRVNVTQP